jgi:hypothetical protein
MRITWIAAAALQAFLLAAACPGQDMNAVRPSMVESWSEIKPPDIAASSVSMTPGGPAPVPMVAEMAYPLTIATKVTQDKSPERRSGAGGAWGDWYYLSAIPQPGWRIVTAAFSTFGDRPCSGSDSMPNGSGNYAECRQVALDRAAGIVTWAFRSQGWSERAGGANTATVVGVLTTTWQQDAQLAPVFTLTFSSPAVWSGRGAKFGCAFDPQYGDLGWWCRVKAQPPPGGYTIKAADFRLIGDRSCAGNDANPNPTCDFAKAKRTSRSDTAADWDFQMQGREDKKETAPTPKGGKTLVGAQGQSQGILTVTYAKGSGPTK